MTPLAVLWLLLSHVHLYLIDQCVSTLRGYITPAWRGAPLTFPDSLHIMLQPRGLSHVPPQTHLIKKSSSSGLMTSLSLESGMLRLRDTYSTSLWGI